MSGETWHAIDGQRFSVRTRAVPPFRAEGFKSGYAAVLDSYGINWIGGMGGATLWPSHEIACRVADALNKASQEAGG